MVDIHEFRRKLKLPMLVAIVFGRDGYWEPEFISGEVVSEPRSIFIDQLGTTLQVPDQQVAVLVGNGRQVIYPQGYYYLDLPVGQYVARSVQVFQQRPTVLEPVTRLSRDGLEVTLRVRLIWRVIDPLAVLDKRGFHNSLYTTSVALTAAFIRSQRYDRLVQTPGGAAMSTFEISAHLRNDLQQTGIFAGIELSDVIVEPPVGNRDLQEAAQEALVDASITRLEQEKLERRRELELRRAIVDREVAVEQQQLQVEAAKKFVEVEQAKRPVLDQELEYQERRNQVDLRAEGGRMVLEFRKEVLLRLVESLTTSLMTPSLLGQIGGMDSAVVRQMVQSVLEGLDPSMLMLGGGANGRSSQPEVDPLILRLAREVAEAQLHLPALEWRGMRPERTGEVTVLYAYKGVRFKLLVPRDYPISGPRVSSDLSSNAASEPYRPKWNPRKRLIDLLVRVAGLIDSSHEQHKRPGGSSDLPPSVAG